MPSNNPNWPTPPLTRNDLSKIIPSQQSTVLRAIEKRERREARKAAEQAKK